MAKVMLVKCGPRLVEFIQNRKRFHIIVAQTNDEARTILEKTAPDLLPDLVVIGTYPRSSSRTRDKRGMIEFAQSLKIQFRWTRIVLINGKIFAKRAPNCADGVCRGLPAEVFTAIQKILSPAD